MGPPTMLQRPSKEPGSVRSARELADRLGALRRRVPVMARLFGIGACRTGEQRFAFHLHHAARSLKKRDVAGAETELRAALSVAEPSALGPDIVVVRSVLSEVRRSVLRPIYEEELAAASASPDPGSTRRRLLEARRIAEEMGESEEVRWLDEMIQGPKLRTAGPGGGGPLGREDRREGPSPTYERELGRPAQKTREEQRAQFRRVANDSRAYASKRLRSKR